jgi:uncharacterized SAM-binding protein YcdF (DUF218 family)
MRFLKWLGIAGVLGFVISVHTPLWNYLARPMVVEPSVQAGDAIIVLGAGVLSDQTLTDESLRRAIHGLRLFNRGLAPLLVLSGPRRKDVPGLSEAEVRRDLAIQWGIPAGQILVVSDVMTTQEESLKIAAALSERGASTALLVTSALHMRRAKGVFEKAGLIVLAAPSDNYPRAAVGPQERLLLMMSVLEQGMALLQYRLAGYV